MERTKNTLRPQSNRLKNYRIKKYDFHFYSFVFNFFIELPWTKQKQNRKTWKQNASSQILDRTGLGA